MEVGDLYLRQLMRSLARYDYIDDFTAPEPSRSSLGRMRGWLSGKLVAARGLDIVKRVKFDAEKRTNGRDWPINADTMIGMKRLQNIVDSVRVVVEEKIPGDLIETGVWRGGGSILMRAALEAYGDKTRKVWCADSFEGLPAPELDRYPQDAGMTWHTFDQLSVSLDGVKANFAKYDLLDERVVFLKGWFKDTLPGAAISKIAILRLDGDLYASTMDSLNNLFDKVSVGGFIIVDDYGIPEDTCRRAIEDFRAARKISDMIIDIDGWGKYWRKSK